MEKEELQELKQKLNSLSKDEWKQREIYLYKLAIGEIQGPQTGYPSIDKPQLKYYDLEKYLSDVPKENIYESLCRQNIDNLDQNAISFFMTNIKYSDFIKKIQDLIKALSKNGIKEGDYVTCCLASIPESMALLYALGYLGATGIFMPPYLDKKTMINDINKDKSSLLFIMDTFYDDKIEYFDEIIKNTSIKKTVVVPVLNSSVLGLLKRKKKSYNNTIELYDSFIKNAKNVNLPKMVEYYPNMPVAVVYSSGTTGILKGVLLSHDTFNNSATSYISFGFDLSKGQKVYQAIPVWSSTGLIADGATALYYGCTLYQNPKFDPIIYSKNLGIHRINWGIATTELFNGICTLKDKKLFNLMLKTNLVNYKKLNNVYIGGTLATPKDKKRINEVLKSIGSNAKIRSSYGNCENGSIVTAELNGINHPDKSVGVPIPGTTVMIVDSNNHELSYNQRGEITVKTTCGMIGYYNRPDLDSIFFSDESGNNIYKHTGDIGYIMPTGDVIYEGRANDFSIINNQKIYNFDIKNVILLDSDISDCEVFTYGENQLCVNMILNEAANINISQKILELQEKIFGIFHNINYVPELFKIRDSFPMSRSTKRDFIKIKNEKEGYLKVDKNYLIEKAKQKVIKK